MKKLVLFSLGLFTGLLAVAQEQLPNGGFENWKTDTIFNLAGYLTSSIDNGGWNNSTIRSTDSYSGNYALKLQSEMYGNKLGFGFAVNFNPETFNGGAPFTFQADYINGYYKAGVQGADSALILVMLKSNGMVIGGAQIKFSADENTEEWTKFTVPTGLLPGITPDTLMFGAVSSNALTEVGMTAGSWLMLDSVYFTSENGGLALLVNYDFESWEEFYSENPEGFNSSLNFVPFSDPPLIEKTTDASEGNFAVKLNSIVDDLGDSTGGMLTTGNILFDNYPLPGGAPFNGTPVSVSYDYQNFRIGNEPASVDFIFKKNGNILFETGMSYDSNTDGYASDTLELQLSETPDTLLFTAWNGNDPESWFIIDNIRFHYLVGIDEIAEIREIIAYPNPSVNALYFSIDAIINAEASVDIIDLTGKIISSGKFAVTKGKNQHRVDVSALSKGTYLYRITFGQSTYTKTFLKQ